MNTTAAPARVGGTGWALLAAATVCGAAAVALALRVVALAPETTGAGPDDLVELAVSAVGVAVLTWLGVSAAVATWCVALRAAGRSWRRGEAAVHRFAPVLVRRALAVAVAAGLGLGGAGAATADDGTPVQGAATIAVTTDAGPDLGWVVSGEPTPGPTAQATTDAPAPSLTDTTPTVAEDGARPSPTPTASRAGANVLPTAASSTPSSTASAPNEASATSSPGRATGNVPGTPAPRPAVPLRDVPTPAAVSPVATPDAPDTVTVHPGDTLWAIAARHLGPDASDARIAAAWPTWYAANASLVGPNPDLIQPGQVLTVPAELAR